MPTKQQSERRSHAATELRAYYTDLSSRQVVDSLMVGLTNLRNLLMVRAHDDVERKYGADSMIGTSSSAIERRAHFAKVEVEAYSCVVFDDEVSRNGYLSSTDEWFLDWIFRLRFGEGYESVLEKRVDYYRSHTIEERRLKFVSVLQRAVPESARAPLVLYRLYPRSVRISAAVAFGDILRAQELRQEQSSLLPATSDCHECHGSVLDNDEICRFCGNPVWNFASLLSD